METMADKTISRPPFVCPALVPAAAALCGVFLCAGRTPAEFVIAGVVAVATLFLFRKDRVNIFVFLSAAVLFFVWTWVLAPAKIPDGEKIIRGVCADIRKYPVSQKAILETAGCGRVSLSVIDIVPDIAEGDIIEVKAILSPPDRYAGVPGMKMEGLTARAERISCSAVVAPGDIKIVGKNNSVLYRLLEKRRDLCDAIAALPVSDGASGLLSTSLFGVRDLDPDVRDSFRLSGLAHLLCVSGFHVGLLAAVILFLFWPVRVVRPWLPARYLVAASVVWVYALLVGFGPSAVRAAVMITVFALVRSFQRRALPLNTLCVAFVAVMALDPYRVFSAGFQLSFAAVTGLLLLAPKLNPVPGRKRLAHAAVNLFVVPFSALLATLPVTLVWFHHVPLLSVPSNALAVNLFPAFMICGLISLVLFQAGLPCAVPCWCTDKIYYLLKHIADGASGISARFDVALYPDTMVVVLLVVALGALIVLLHVPSWRRPGALVSAGCLILCAGCSRPARGTEILIDGNGRGTDIIVASAGSAQIFHSGREASPVALRFCEARGCIPVVGPLAGLKTIAADKSRIAVLDSENDLPEEGEIVVVLCRNSSIPAVLGRRPCHIVLGALLRPDERDAWTYSCRQAGVGYTDLRFRAFYRGSMQ